MRLRTEEDQRIKNKRLCMLSTNIWTATGVPRPERAGAALTLDGLWHPAGHSELQQIKRLSEWAEDQEEIKKEQKQPKLFNVCWTIRHCKAHIFSFNKMRLCKELSFVSEALRMPIVIAKLCVLHRSSNKCQIPVQYNIINHFWSEWKHV